MGLRKGIAHLAAALRCASTETYDIIASNVRAQGCANTPNPKDIAAHVKAPRIALMGKRRDFALIAKGRDCANTASDIVANVKLSSANMGNASLIALNAALRGHANMEKLDIGA